MRICDSHSCFKTNTLKLRYNVGPKTLSKSCLVNFDSDGIHVSGLTVESVITYLLLNIKLQFVKSPYQRL